MAHSQDASLPHLGGYPFLQLPERIDVGDQIKRMHQPGGDGSLCNADDAENSTMPMDGRRMSQPPVLNIEVSSHSSGKSALKGTAEGVDHAAARKVKDEATNSIGESVEPRLLSLNHLPLDQRVHDSYPETLRLVSHDSLHAHSRNSSARTKESPAVIVRSYIRAGAKLVREADSSAQAPVRDNGTEGTPGNCPVAAQIEPMAVQGRAQHARDDTCTRGSQDTADVRRLGVHGPSDLKAELQQKWLQNCGADIEASSIDSRRGAAVTSVIKEYLARSSVAPLRRYGRQSRKQQPFPNIGLPSFRSRKR
ncbi:hypothetical protein DER45DRAFT_539778 [Fusarium avenaceum]|nr:hypothetical protein DER45DRAFT_539778 [Fusarium avenaceum]